MHRQGPSLLAVVALSLTAALVPGAAVFARAGASFSCADAPPPVAGEVTAANVVLVATVVELSPRSLVRLRPEVYLKGAARAEDVELRFPAGRPEECPFAEFAAGSRVLAILGQGNQGAEWPDATAVYLLEGGKATRGGAGGEARSEADLVREIRGLTNQYAVPAASKDEGATIDWTGTILPLGGALLLVFGISLVLMRHWHRIDPS